MSLRFFITIYNGIICVNLNVTIAFNSLKLSLIDYYLGGHAVA
jgi:hypothetical protein